ncbi:MAG: glycosyltransferase [Candidatus Cloacimonetes bacterium]|nr:glycosyltransferase [Candidatus Cloacimonadota bacterium]NLO11102.1 glycosyltransferase [Candidatus Cloacimonadota bacterium]
MMAYLQLAFLYLFNLVIEGLFLIFKPVLCFFLKRIKYQDSLIAEGQALDGGILFHAASMGEVNALKPLILALLKQKPNTKIAVTTTTVNGLKAASVIHPSVYSRLSVFDIYSLRKKQLKTFNPGLLCVMETEIWPNLLLLARSQKIPVLFINARLSERSVKRLRAIRPLLKILERPICEIMAKSEEDAQRFEQLFDTKITVAGNLKFAALPIEIDAAGLRQKWGFATSDLIICAGSTRPGEEQLLLKAFSKLQHEYPHVKLIIVPRHLNRMDEIVKLLEGFSYRLFSDEREQAGSAPIFVLDAMGWLNHAYSICDIAVVGGSFYNFGGHNPVEPANFGKPILMGPHHSSCVESVEALLQDEAILVVDKKELDDKLTFLLDNPLQREKMGERARKVISRFQDSLDKYLQGVKRCKN